MRGLFLVAALTLVACSPPGAPAGAASQQNSAATPQPAANQTAKPDPFQNASAAPVLDRAFLVGRWGDNGDCVRSVVDLASDGSFTTGDGGQGQWTLTGATLRMAGKADTIDLRLELIDQNTLRITNPDGSVGRYQRY